MLSRHETHACLRWVIPIGALMLAPAGCSFDTESRGNAAIGERDRDASSGRVDRADAEAESSRGDSVGDAAPPDASRTDPGDSSNEPAGMEAGSAGAGRGGSGQADAGAGAGGMQGSQPSAAGSSQPSAAGASGAAGGAGTGGATASGAAGGAGVAGASGAGAAGDVGAAGSAGADGVGGESGGAGAAGMAASGAGGEAGIAGASGAGGVAGTAGVSGAGGDVGMAGASAPPPAAGMSGSPGPAGADGGLPADEDDAGANDDASILAGLVSLVSGLTAQGALGATPIDLLPVLTTATSVDNALIVNVLDVLDDAGLCEAGMPACAEACELMRGRCEQCSTDAVCAASWADACQADSAQCN